MANVRSAFPVGNDVGVKFARVDDNQNVRVDVWGIKAGNALYAANLILPHNAPEGAVWMIGSVINSTRKPIWSYKDDARVAAGFDGRAFPYAFDGLSYIVYLTKTADPQVAYVVPLLQILEQKEPQEPIDETIALKVAVAADLNLTPKFSFAEAAWNQILAAEALEANKAAEQAAYQQRADARLAKIGSILARPLVTVPVSGRSISAIPVTGDEWKMLPNRTVVVQGDIDVNETFEAKETFTVVKSAGKAPSRQSVIKVGEAALQVAASKKVELPKPISEKLVRIKGRGFQVPTFGRIEDLQALRAAGLNGGAYRGIQKPAGVFELFEVHHDGLKQVGASDFMVMK